VPSLDCEPKIRQYAHQLLGRREGCSLPYPTDAKISISTIMLVIRLSRTGKKKQPTYRVVVQEKQRDPWGTSVEIVGNYNPLTSPSTLNLKEDRIKHWLSVGAQPSDTMHNLLIDAGLIEGKKVRATTHDKKEPAPAEEKAKEAPTEDKPAEEAPAPEPKAEEAPTEEEPKAEEPKEEEKPAEEPKEEAPAEEVKSPAAEAPGDAEEAPAEEPKAEEAPAEEEPSSAEAPEEEKKEEAEA